MLSAVNSANPKAVSVVELIKNSVKGLHQLNFFQKTEESEKSICKYILSFESLNTEHPGY